MINWARTLLCNVSGNSRPALGELGEDYIDESYQSVALPTHLKSIHRILFGTKPEPLYMNYRVSQLLHVLHSTEFAEYLTANDQRITYDLEDTEFYDQYFGTLITTITRVPGIVPSIVGGPVADDLRGISRTFWRITLEDSLVTIINDREGTMVNGLVSITDGMSALIALDPWEALALQFSAESGASLDGGSWTIEATARPGNIRLLDRISALGHEALGQLFTGGEPFTTFRNLWEMHPRFEYRLSGILLAFIHQVDGLNNG